MVKTTELVAAKEFEIAPLGFDKVEPKDRAAIIKFVGEVQKLAIAVRGASSVMSESKGQLEAMRSVVRNSSDLDPTIENAIRELELRLMDLQEKFDGDPTKSRRNEPALPGLNSRLRNVMSGAMGSTEGPTGTHRRQFEIAGEQFDGLIGELRKLVEVDIQALHDQLDKAGAPWTPGRKIPQWKK